MQVFTNMETLPENLKGAGIALGAFDGLHLGHIAVINNAKIINRPTGLIIFEPPPKLYFAKDKTGLRLASLNVTIELSKKLNLDFLYVIDFNQEIASLSPDEFIALLQNKISPKLISVGHDFNFGKGRSADANYLKEKCAGLGIETNITSEFTDDEERISSTRIRNEIISGNILAANKLLGHAWTIEGIVEHGQKLGRKLGFPTANLKLKEQLEPKYGIYAVKVNIGDGVWRIGVANFGRTPTTGIRDPLFEAFILDFDGDLYDKNIMIEIHEYLRGEEKFDNIDELIVQMHEDVKNTRNFFEKENLKATNGI